MDRWGDYSAMSLELLQNITISARPRLDAVHVSLIGAFRETQAFAAEFTAATDH